MTRPDHRLGSISQYRRDLCHGLCQGLVGHLWLRGLTWCVGTRLIQVARSLLVAVSPPVLLRLGERGAMGVSTPDVAESSASSASPSSTPAAFQVGMLLKFFDQWRSITSNRFVCLIWFGVTIFSLGLILPCCITSGNLMSRWLQVIIPLFRMRLMSFLLRQQLNHLLVVLVHGQVCLWFLSILGASDPYLT